MAAGSGKPSTGIEQGAGLGQAVSAKSLKYAFLTGKKWVTAIHTARDGRIGFQLFTKPTVDEYRARVASLGPLYLAYLRDPSGNKICALHRPTKPA